jgi:hypothetical protein
VLPSVQQLVQLSAMLKEHPSAWLWVHPWAMLSVHHLEHQSALL